MLVGGPWHANEKAGEVLDQVLKAAGGRWQLTITSDLGALAALPTSDYSAVIIYTTGFNDALTPARERGLLGFVRGGGGLVGVHSAADSFRDNRAYIEMLNAEFLAHPHFHEFPVSIVDRNHYLAIRDIIDRGLLGEVFHVECFTGGYERPRFWWRSDKMISGGALYDWGAHFTDWILRLFNKKVTQVSGFFHKRLWRHVTNEDATQAILRFEGGEAADLQQSTLAAVARPKWRILGTLGGLVADGGDTVDVTSYASGVKFEGRIPAKPTYGCQEYYRNIADHLLMGEPLAVTAEQAREVIAVIETAERSSAEGRSLPLPGEVYG
jgi:hypothetical protein